jgi:putative aminopeptidase FrvX
VFELVKRLTELPGMIGHEEPVQDFLVERWTPHCEKVTRTGVGNVIAKVGGKGPRLLIEAHADEIGVVVKSISEEGIVFVAPKNGLAANLRPGRDLFILGHPCVIQSDKGLVDGVFAALSGHVTPPELKEKNHLGWSDFFVDVGAASREEVVGQGVRVGDAVIWNPSTRRLGRYIVGKAMDDRAGLAIMTALLERLDPEDLEYELYFASTVQEELGLVGAYSLERDQQYDLAIALDVGLSGDLPGIDEKEMTCRLGGGPMLVHHDGTVHYDRRISRQLTKVAEEADISIQDAVFPRYSSDGHALIKAGLPTGLVAFATRYTHSPFEMLDEGDLEQCVDLLLEYVTRPAWD